MFRGIYTAATGMIAQETALDTIANNLANINTVGFKKDTPTFQELSQMAIDRIQGSPEQSAQYVGVLGMGTSPAQSFTNYTEGELTNTKNPLNLAIVGDGFFSVQTAQGVRFTRNGNFHLQPVNKTTAYLADENNEYVLGQKGPINLNQAQSITITSNGNVFADGKLLDQLKIVNAPATAISKDGNNWFSINGATVPSKAQVKQGFLEQANVNAVKAMVQMISVQRAYEAAQHAITAQDSTLSQTVSDLPKT